MPKNRSTFFQDGPQLKNAYETDRLLKSYIRWKFRGTDFQSINAELSAFGARCVEEIAHLGEMAEAQLPKHVPYDAWGRRIDKLEMAPAWRTLDRISAEEGLIAIGYERKEGELSRIRQFAKLFLFHPSSAFYTCPLAMTDGAARVLELSNNEPLKTKVLGHLTSRDPERFWTSGQWMTERTGGSDVSTTSTIARPTTEAVPDHDYVLTGDKWFTSATTSQMALALAKVEGASDAREGLSLFYVELRDQDGRLRNIRVNRLKDKLGTKALPTAELTLSETPAVLLSQIGEGVKTVATVLNITRLYNSVTALGTMERALSLATDYGQRRHAFGRKLNEQPLHLRTLSRLRIEFEGCFMLVFHLVHLLGKEEVKTATVAEAATLRLLTPIAKLWTAKQCITTCSEVLESFGGAGYVEDSGLPKLLRDSQVFSIWEGTTNVLSLDVLRVLGKEGVFETYLRDMKGRLRSLQQVDLQTASAQVARALRALEDHMNAIAGLTREVAQRVLEAGARDFALAIARSTAAVLLLEFAQAPESYDGAVDVAIEFCRLPLAPLQRVEELVATDFSRLLF